MLIYDININRIRDCGQFDTQYVGILKPTGPELKCMQGGVFSDDGYLFLTNGYYKDFNPKNGGISVYKEYQRVDHSSIKNMPFKYEFHLGWSKYEEPEGITMWDLRDGLAPNITGQLHVIMLDCNASADELYFKHYSIE